MTTPVRPGPIAPTTENTRRPKTYGYPTTGRVIGKEYLPRTDRARPKSPLKVIHGDRLAHSPQRALAREDFRAKPDSL
jgi:hypothetical protein